MPQQFVVLLRGVNVGKGNNKVPMAELRAALEALGYSAVKTLLNSGNAVFSSTARNPAKHAATIAAAVKERFGVVTPIIVKSAAEFAAIVAGNPIAPPDSDHSRFLAVFAMDAARLQELKALQALLRPGERWAVTDHAAYLHCAGGLLDSKLGAALLGKAGRSVTTRNWATVLKLASLLGARAAPVAGCGPAASATYTVLSKRQQAASPMPVVVTLREITAETVIAVVRLSVADDQKHFVASNAVSLAQALFAPEAWYRAIYADEEVAGFVMLSDESLRKPAPAAPAIGVWRLMIDARFQRRGIGRAALRQVIQHVRAKGIFKTLELSYVPGPGCPEPFYVSLGFRPTGRMDEDEVVLELPLGQCAGRP